MSLRYPKGAERIGIVFNRNIRRNFEENTWPAIPRTFTPYRMNYAADLVGIKPPDPRLNIQFNPYTLGRGSQIRNLNEDATQVSGDLGGELKWVINSNAVLDLT
ncbi:hypothetical protein RZS08_59120, partial [Arthrospira platensis SPKY1]|nr:hypothetical protein [Arthrospira platensis SPKY1]